MEKKLFEKQPRLDATALAANFYNEHHRIADDESLTTEEKYQQVSDLLDRNVPLSGSGKTLTRNLEKYAVALIDKMTLDSKSSGPNYVRTAAQSACNHLALQGMTYQQIADMTHLLHEEHKTDESTKSPELSMIAGIYDVSVAGAELTSRSIVEQQEAEQASKVVAHTPWDALSSEATKNIATSMIGVMRDPKWLTVGVATAIGLTVVSPAANAATPQELGGGGAASQSSTTREIILDMARAADKEPIVMDAARFGAEPAVPVIPPKPPRSPKSAEAELDAPSRFTPEDGVEQAKEAPSADLANKMSLRFDQDADKNQAEAIGQKSDDAPKKSDDEKPTSDGPAVQIPNVIEVPDNTAKRASINEGASDFATRTQEEVAPEVQEERDFTSRFNAPKDETIEDKPTPDKNQNKADRFTESGDASDDKQEPVVEPDMSDGPTMEIPKEPVDDGPSVEIPDTNPAIEIPNDKWDASKMPDGKKILAELQKKYGVHKSGELNADELVLVDPEIWGQLALHPEAAAGMRAMNEAYKADFGKNIDFTDSYRSLEIQKECYYNPKKIRKDGTHMCATPGKSNHGWGLAVDFSSDMNMMGENLSSRYDSKEYKWLLENGARFGWVNPEWAQEFDQDGVANKHESWHAEFDGSKAADMVYYSNSLADRKAEAKKKKESTQRADQGRERRGSGSASESQSGVVDKRIDEYDLSASRKTFLKRLTHGAAQLQKEDAPVNLEVMMAQGIHESRWGESGLAAKYNNLFGMKAGSDWKGKTVVINTWEVINGKDVTVPATWRVYDSYEDSMRDYAFGFIGKKAHYADAVAQKDSVDGYLNGLLAKLDSKGNILIPQGQQGAMSFATDPKYKDNIKRAIKSCELDNLLKMATEVTPPKRKESNEQHQASKRDKDSQISQKEKMADILKVNQSWNNAIKPTTKEHGITSHVGKRAGGTNYHRGIDYAVPSGTPFHAMFDGVVTTETVNTSTRACNNLLRNLGADPSARDPIQKNVYVTSMVDGQMVTVYYGHLSEFGPPNGSVVKAGDVIGLSGGTGCSTGPHGHIEGTSSELPKGEMTADNVAGRIDNAIAKILPGRWSKDVVTDFEGRVNRSQNVKSTAGEVTPIDEREHTSHTESTSVPEVAERGKKTELHDSRVAEAKTDADKEKEGWLQVKREDVGSKDDITAAPNVEEHDESEAAPDADDEAAELAKVKQRQAVEAEQLKKKQQSRIDAIKKVAELKRQRQLPQVDNELADVR